MKGNVGRVNNSLFMTTYYDNIGPDTMPKELTKIESGESQCKYTNVEEILKLVCITQ